MNVLILPDNQQTIRTELNIKKGTPRVYTAYAFFVTENKQITKWTGITNSASFPDNFHGVNPWNDKENNRNRFSISNSQSTLDFPPIFHLHCIPPWFSFQCIMINETY